MRTVFLLMERNFFHPSAVNQNVSFYDLAVICESLVPAREVNAHLKMH